MITQTQLHAELDYDPDTGVFTWRNARPGVRQGAEAGRVSPSHGYRDITLWGRQYRANRLAFMWMRGAWPNGDAEHKDRDKANNRWANLRDATRSQNMANVGLRSNNKSGVSGVVWDADRGKWRAQLRVAGIKTNLGRFDTIDEAATVVRDAAIKQWGEFAA